MPAGAADNAAPPPGLYEVGQVATLEVRSPPANVQRLTQRTDGHTGDKTVVRSVEPSGSTSTERVPGGGPVQACLRPGRPPEWLQVAACGPEHRVKTPDGRLLTVDCVPAAAGSQWQRVDESTWEHRYQVALTPAGGRMSAATASAMAPAIAAMESAMKSAPPAEAQAMRRQLEALRDGGSSSIGRTWHVTERWKRLAERCP